MYTEELLPFIFYTARGMGVGLSMILNSAQLLYVHTHVRTHIHTVEQADSYKLPQGCQN